MGPSIAAAGESDSDLLARAEALPKLVNADSDLVRRGALCSVDCQLGVGDRLFHLRIAEGHVASFERGPILMRPWRFSFRASAMAWREFWQPLPKPGWHDLFALAKRGEARLEGDIAPFMTHLQFFKDVLAAPRSLHAVTR